MHNNQRMITCLV